MQASRYLQTIENNGHSLVYHSLRGNLFLLDPEYLAFLKMVVKSKVVSADIQNKKMVSELIKAGYIVNGRENERDFLRIKNERWMKKVVGGGQLRLLNLMISEACNFGCAHCLHRCSVQTGSTHGKKKLMGWQTAKTAIESYCSILQRWGNRHLNIHFGSAEPLVNWPVLKRSIEYIRSIDNGAQLAVNTNLSLLTMEMAKFFRDNRVYISTSLDGPLEGNDAIRVFKDGSGTFNTILEKFKMLFEIGYPLDGFSITINDLNFNALNPDFIYWAHNQGFRGIACDIDLINVVNASRPLKDCLQKLIDLRRACLKCGMENFGSWTTAYDNLVNEPEDEMPTFCKAVKGRNISVNPSGRIFVCGHTNSFLGTIDEFDQVFKEGQPYFNLIRSRLPGNDEMCYGCDIEGICAGQCQITREVSRATKNDRDALLCRFYRQATRRLLEEKLITELHDRQR
jgi:uncharacterized protein